MEKFKQLYKKENKINKELIEIDIKIKKFTNKILDLEGKLDYDRREERKQQHTGKETSPYSSPSEDIKTMG